MRIVNWVGLYLERGTRFLSDVIRGRHHNGLADIHKCSHCHVDQTTYCKAVYTGDLMYISAV